MYYNPIQDDIWQEKRTMYDPTAQRESICHQLKAYTSSFPQTVE